MQRSSSIRSSSSINITKNGGGAAASSVWETRMKMDEMKGGVKVFTAAAAANGDDPGGLQVYTRLRRNRSDDVAAAAADRRKRMNWRPPEPFRSPPVKLRKSLSDSPKSSREVSATDEKSPANNAGEETASAVVEDHCEDGEAAEVEVEEGRKSFDDKEMDLPIEKLKNVEKETILPPDVEKKPDSVLDLRSVNPDVVTPPRPPPPNDEVEEEKEEEEEEEKEEELLDRKCGGEKRMQGIVDLIMWRDISRSAFVFGSGTFFLLSSSYMKDLNFSLISAISYLGLVYLAIIFLYKSILHRGGVEFDERDGRQIVGEDEAIWLVRLLLPCINELLLKMRALFSGDPATTMKLAMLLFVMARCGSSITIWTLSKLVFFGVFTIPKICSSYSVQLARYGKFWLERFRDGWESCTHKKAVAAAIFTVIWNLSSTVARVWAVFMLIVAVRFYQQCMVVEEWSGGEDVSAATDERQEDSKPEPGPKLGPGHPGPVLHRHRSGPTLMEVGSERKLRRRL